MCQLTQIRVEPKWEEFFFLPLFSWAFVIPVENPISSVERELMVTTDLSFTHVTNTTIYHG